MPKKEAKHQINVSIGEPGSRFEVTYLSIP